MKKFFIVCVFALTLGLLSSPVFAIQYCKDFLEDGNPGGWTSSLKTFDDEATVSFNQTFELDVWVNDLPEGMFTGGFTLYYDPQKIEVLDILPYDGTNGPWSSGSSVIVDVEPGTYFVALAQMGCADPDADGDLILAKIILKTIATHEPTSITIITDDVPGYDMFVNCISPYIVYDSLISPNTMNLFQLPCITDDDCLDSLYCNGIESCDEGICQSGLLPCDDLNECTEDCNEDLDQCTSLPLPYGTPCTDDANPCTDDFCVSSVCSHPNNNDPCDDSIDCTEADACTDGSCTGTPNNSLCSDGKQCTDDYCDAQIGCINDILTGPCEDGLYCTQGDQCDEQGDCIPGEDPCELPLLCNEDHDTCGLCFSDEECDDGDVCTDDICNPEQGCLYTNNNAPCQDGLYCTTGDICTDGECLGRFQRFCTSGPNQCEEGICDEELDQCTIGPKEDGAECDDGIYCNGVDTCIQGNCDDHPGDPCQYCFSIGCICDESKDSCIDCLADLDCDGICDPGNSEPNCTGTDNCPTFSNPLQHDSYPPGGNGCGDACECEGNFNPDVDDDVDGSDGAIFKADFGRNEYNGPCESAGNPCHGDFECDGDVDGTDASIFKADFGRNEYFYPCPSCPTDPWCNYPE